VHMGNACLFARMSLHTYPCTCVRAHTRAQVRRPVIESCASERAGACSNACLDTRIVRELMRVAIGDTPCSNARKAPGCRRVSTLVAHVNLVVVWEDARKGL